MKRRLKINGFIMSLAVFSVIFFPALFLRGDNNDLSEGLTEIIGIALILLGQLLRASGRGYKSENSANSRSLIQAGPYAVSRNPMYLGIFLIGLGIVMVLFRWWVLFIFLALFIIRYIALIFKEEKKLAALFPEAYRNYQRSVPRLLPSLSMIAAQDISEYLPLKISWLKKEIGSILAVLSITLILESREDIKFAGLKDYLREALGIAAVIILFVCLAGYLIRRTKNGVSNKG